MTKPLREPEPTNWPDEETEVAPPMWMALSEPARAMVDVSALIAAAPWLSVAPPGDGHPVLVLPGLMANDISTMLLRNFLEMLDYRVHPWHMGRNVGPTANVVAELPAAVERIAERNRSKVSVIGWSLGGIYARSVAQWRPHFVRQVITLGSPYRLSDAGIHSTRASAQFQKFSHLHVIDEGDVPSTRLSSARLSMPATSIYSKLDGIVPWQRCIEPEGPISENIRVHASHIGLGFDPLTLWAIADRLAQPPGEWAPFRPSLPLRMLYPPVDKVAVEPPLQSV